MPRRLGVGPAGEPDVIGVADQRRPHLLAVDDVVVAVADGGGPQAGEVGSRLRLGVADREMQLPGGDPGQVERLLLVGPEPHDRRSHGVDRQERHGNAGYRRLVGEDQLVGDGGVAAAVGGGPAQRQPAVGAKLADDLPVGGAVAVVSAGPSQGGPALWRHHAGEVLAQLAAQLLLLWRVGQMHAASAALCAGRPAGRRPARTAGSVERVLL